MKTKSLLLGLVATLGVATANAGTKVYYQQNFETATTAEEAGWASPNLASAMSIASDEYGKFFQFSHGNNNDRSANLTWSSSIWTDSPEKYTVTFDFNMATAPNNHYTTDITIFTDQAPKANTTYVSGSAYPNYLFDLQMVTDANTWYLNGDDTNTLTLTAATWYTVTLDVDVNARTVDYSMVTITGENVTSGQRIVPEGVSMYAEGLNLVSSRHYSVWQFDNINISAEVDGDFATAPAVALTRVGKDVDGNLSLNTRAYTITFGSEETLHIIGTDGVEQEWGYSDCDGSYVYETTTSGTITAWTTSGDATSEKVETAVDCSPCALPLPELAVSSVKEGYAKTYTVTIDNSTTPLSPQIFFTYSFTPKGGTASEESEELGTGSKISVDGEGTLTLTTKAFGYQSSTTTVENNIEYTQKEEQDFAHMNSADIVAKGYAKIDDLNSATTSGESNWTARKRLYYWDAADYAVAEDGSETGTKVYPFGYVDDTGDYCIHRYQAEVDASTNTLTTDASTFGSVSIANGVAVQWFEHIGLLQPSYPPNNLVVTIGNLDNGDVVVLNTIDNYGGDSNHPVCSSVDDYYKQLAGTDYVYTAAADGTLDETTGKYSIAYNLYRIQTALTKVQIFAPKNGSGIKGITADKAIEDANAPYYTISGMKVSAPTQKGIYIHNGKKIIIK